MSRPMGELATEASVRRYHTLLSMATLATMTRYDDTTTSGLQQQLAVRRSLPSALECLKRELSGFWRQSFDTTIGAKFFIVSW